MDKTDYRTVINFFHLKSKLPTEIKNKLHSVYSDASLSFSMLENWALEFKRTRASICDDKRLGRPKPATTGKSLTKCITS